MQKKRDRLEIIFNILKIIQDHKNSIKPTPLLRYANVSSQSFTEYYNELMSKGFIREDLDKKGKKFTGITKLYQEIKQRKTKFKTVRLKRIQKSKEQRQEVAQFELNCVLIRS